jgi:hypothetical protein
MAKTCHVQDESTKQDEIFAYRISQFCRIYGIGRTSAYALIKEGKLATVKIRGMRLIPRASAIALFSGEGRI